MTHDMIPQQQPEQKTLWGEANPLRGAKYHEIALAFSRRFPPGTVLNPDDFDQWAQHTGLLNLPEGAPKQSDAWKAHLQRRHELKHRINTAGSHPRMATPFIIKAIREGVWEVCTPQMAIAQTDLMKRIYSLCKIKRQWLMYLMQSADWSILPPHERAFADALYDDISMFEQNIEMQCGFLVHKFDKLEARLKRCVQSGEIQPQEGNFQGMIGNDDDDA